MAELFAYNEKVETIFDLIGDRENDRTNSIAWAFVKSPNLLEKVIEYLFHVNVDADNAVIRYQEFEKGRASPTWRSPTTKSSISSSKQNGVGFLRASHS